MVLARQLAHMRLAHVAQRKTRAAQLLLGKAEKKIGLVLGWISGAQEQPAVALRRKLAASVVPSRQQVSADLPCGNQQLVKLQMVVAQAAGNRRPAGNIFVNERTHHV